MSTVIQNKFPILNKITNYGTQIAANNVQFTSQINTINQKLSTYTKNAGNVTISQPLLGDQLYTLNLNSDPKQYVQCEDFINLKKVVLGIDLVNNFQSTLESMGGMDDLQKILKQKTDKITQDDINNLFILSVPVQSSNATQTTTVPSQYVTYYQYNLDITRIDNKMSCMLQTSGNNAQFRADVQVDGVLKNLSSTLVPLNDNEYTTKYFSDQVQAEVQEQVNYFINQITDVDMNALVYDQNTVSELDLGIVNWNINDVPVMKQTLSTYTRSANNVVISQPLLGDRVYEITSTTSPRQYIQYQEFKNLQQVVLGIDVVNNFQEQLNAAGGMDDQLKLLVQKTSKVTQDDVNNLFIVTNPLQCNNSTQTTTNAKQYITYYQYNTDLSVLQDKTSNLTHDSVNSLLICSIPFQSSNDQQLATDAKQYVTYYQHNYDNQLLIDKTYCMTQDQGQHCLFRGNVQVPGAITNTNSSLVPLNLNEYVTKYYVDQQRTLVQTALSQYSQTQDVLNTDVQNELQYIVSQISNTSQIQYQATNQTYTLSNLLISNTLSNASSVLVPQADNEYITKYYMSQQLTSIAPSQLTGTNGTGTNVLLDNGTFGKITNSLIVDGTLNISKLTGTNGTGTNVLLDNGTFGKITNSLIVDGTLNISKLTGISGSNSGTNYLNDKGQFVAVSGGSSLVVYDTSYNTFLGNSALVSKTTGNSNTAIGYQSLYSNTTGQNNIAIGYQSLKKNTEGNSNTANGFQSLYNNTIGNYNTANGELSLYKNTEGNNNTANGFQSLFSNTTGSQNSANGAYSLSQNTIGNENTANGYQTLSNNQTGTQNTATGCGSLTYNNTGIKNTANGYQSLFKNTSGLQNTADGFQSLYFNTTGQNNTAIGTSSLYTNTTGNKNTAIGVESLYFNNGYNNTAIGYQAGMNNTSWSNCTFLGYQAGSTMNATADNQIWLGSSTTSVYVNGGNLNLISDKRDKTQIQETQLGLQFINKLKPVDYKWNYRCDYNEMIEEEEITTDENGNEIKTKKMVLKKNENDGSKTRKRNHHGLIAQDVQQVINETGIDFGGFQDHTVNGGGEQMTIDYIEFIGPLIKAVQQLNQKLELVQSPQQELLVQFVNLTQELIKQQNEVEDLKKQLNDFKQQDVSQLIAELKKEQAQQLLELKKEQAQQLLELKKELTKSMNQQFHKNVKQQ